MFNKTLDEFNKFTEKFKSQNYEKIKNKCLTEKVLFVDETFPANDSSLLKNNSMNGIVWKRPHEISQNPRLVVDNISSQDVNQGLLGNCWFVAALSVLASGNKLLNKVIPDLKEQEINEKNYAGIFKFSFWRFGEWVEVIIDDLLPTDANNRLIFTHSSTKNEYWSSLLEKAYAKFNGCYAYLDGGCLSEALQDFTGGICETIDLTNDYKSKNSVFNDNLFEMMKKAYDRKSLMASAINTTSNNQIEEKLSCGLVKGHAYGITKIQQMTIKGNSLFSFLPVNREKLQMIRLKNPWGDYEWNGQWSDKSEAWNRVPKSERDKMGLNFDEDGEFWMEFSDFLYYFNEVSICRIINTALFSIRKTWSEGIQHGRWSLEPSRAGGCINNYSSFCENPQYLFEIDNNYEKPDEVLINLDQVSLRCIGRDNLTIGFYIMRVEDNRKYRLHMPKPKTASSSFINRRSVFLREKLPNGRYICIPSTFDKGIEGLFLLRVYTDNSNDLREIIKEIPLPFLAKVNPFAKYAKFVTSIRIKSGSNLVNVENSSKLNTYICIKCEKQRVVGRTIKDSCNPEWDTSAIFYRLDEKKPINIEIWISNPIKDELYGDVSLDCEPNNRHILIQCGLKGRKTDTLSQLAVEIQSMNDVKAL